MRTREAKEVKWSSVKDTLDLFMHKLFEYLWKADYIPGPVKMELHQVAIAQDLIGGVASDYNMQGQAPASSHQMQLRILDKEPISKLTICFRIIG